MDKVDVNNPKVGDTFFDSSTKSVITIGAVTNEYVIAYDEKNREIPIRLENIVKYYEPVLKTPKIALCWGLVSPYGRFISFGSKEIARFNLRSNYTLGRVCSYTPKELFEIANHSVGVLCDEYSNPLEIES